MTSPSVLGVPLTAQLTPGGGSSAGAGGASAVADGWAGAKNGRWDESERRWLAP